MKVEATIMTVREIYDESTMQSYTEVILWIPSKDKNDKVLPRPAIDFSKKVDICQ